MHRAARVTLAMASLCASSSILCPAWARDVAFHVVLQATSGSGWGVAGGDLNGNGSLDLVFTDDVADTVKWMDPKIPNSVTSLAGSVNGASGVAVADFDGDGDLDVAVAARDAGEVPDDVVIFFNLGDGSSWSAPERVADQSEGATDLAAGDLDGDGDVDLVGVVTELSSDLTDDVIRRWRNPGGGTGWIANPVSTTTDGVEDVELADVDEDGDLDVIAGSDGRVEWFANGGNAGGWTPTTVDIVLGAAVGVDVADLDLDGDPDVVAALEGSGEAVYWANIDGDGSTWSGDPQPIGDVTSITAVGVADLDGDGDNDVAATGAGFAVAAGWFEQTSPDVWLWRAIDELGQRTSRRLLVVDLHEDGDSDLVYPSAGNGSGIWSMENRDHRRRPRFRPETSHDSGFSRRSTDDWARGDLDGDGREEAVFNDLYVCCPDEDRLMVARGAPGANDDILGFAVDVLAIADGRLSFLDVGDVDGDGDLDVLTGPHGLGEMIDIYENEGTDSFWTGHTVINDNSEPSFWDIATGDLDGDGDLDIAGFLEGFTDRVMGWWEQVGDPFTTLGWTRHEIAVASDASLLVRQVRVGDVDGDGDLDIVTAHDSQVGPIIFWRNLGTSPPTFSRNNLPTPGTARFELADFDRDGDLDVGGEGAWWENDPDAVGDWVRRPVEGMAALSAFDLDRDGDVDLVGGTCEDENGQEAIGCWWRNEARNPGLVDFYGYPTHILSLTTEWLVASDFDGDHDGDLLGGQGFAAFTGSLRNTGGQAALAAEPLADFGLAAGETGTVLALDFEFGGSFGDGAMEVATIAFDLEADGTPVDTVALASLVAAMEVWRDDGDGVRNAGDTLVTRQTSLTATSGRVALLMPDADPALQLSWDDLEDAVPARLWVDLELAAGAGSTGVDSLGIDYDPEAGNVVESVIYDKPLTIERERPYHLDVSIVDGPQPPWSGFSDSFETGSTSAWSGHSPP